MRNLFKNFIFFIIIFLVLIALFSSYNATFDKSEEVSLNTLVQEVEDEKVDTIVVKGTKIEITLKDGTEQVTKKEGTQPISELFANYDLDPEKFKQVQLDVKEDEGLSFWLLNLLPLIIPILLIGAFIYFMMRQVQGANSKAMSFGQSKAREMNTKGKKKVTFKDVAGVKEAKEELVEVVDFLKNPKKYLDLGAKIPKGVLLMGSPGTGKTLMAKAVAGEANVPFYAISGSEFVEMFVGVGASRVRDLFKKAKKTSPCIIFIDEIDAVGRQRGAGLGGSHDEREQTLNQILVEMDGMETETNVIVIAATNRPDVLDPALLRPGRFDRRVVLDMPNIDEREEILKVHAKGKVLDKNVNMREIAERTPGFSGADLSNLLNEGAILAAGNNQKVVKQQDILDSIEKVLLGPERRSHIVSDKEKKITAYHEAGHAFVAHMLPHTDPVHKVSIIARGRAAGYTLKLPEEDRNFHTRTEFIEDLAVLLAGFVAEKEILGEVTTGASNDLQRATKVARNLITQYGMSEHLGLRTFGEKDEMVFLGKEIHERRDYSEKTAEMIDEEIKDLIDEAQLTSARIINENRDVLDEIVKKLMKKETLERKEFERIVGEKQRS